MLGRRFADLLLLRHLDRIGNPLLTDAHLYDHRLDLCPATFHCSWDRAHTAPRKGVGLLQSIQHGGRGRHVYPYAQVIYLRWSSGHVVWPIAGLIVVTLAAGLSLVSLLAMGRRFGICPALRGLVTSGPYRLVRHPMYLSYVLADIGYNLQDGISSRYFWCWSVGSLWRTGSTPRSE
jgi:hypothetical protein